MNGFTSRNYLELMVPWLKVMPQFLRHSPVGTWYGTGESAHWSVQSNMNICAALSVMADSPELDELSPAVSRDEIRQTALELFRYAMRTHLTGDSVATDGKPWGHHWISVLGAERMTHGINALLPHMTDEDREHYRTFRLSEADWLTDEYPVTAGMCGDAGNKPESNIWNGGFLFRCAMDYPDAPRVREYLDKGCSFLLNGLSHPLDAASELEFRGKPLRQWHVGFNFTPNYSLDHHSYLNVGYMAISLSNIAMLHFNFKERGQTPPPELYLHAEDLWHVVKHFHFPDGRLLRIGGDSRARYTYCQCYAVPMWLFAADFLGDREAAAFEKNWLAIMKKEMDSNADGTYYSKRLDNIRRTSYYYYCRLESDPLLVLSCGAYWRRKFSIVQPAEKMENTPVRWSDDYHAAAFIRTGNTVRSWVKSGCFGNVGLCLPLNRSDLAEWHCNLTGYAAGNRVQEVGRKGRQNLLPGGFSYVGTASLVECQPWGEGENPYPVAERQTAVWVLPDGKSMIVAVRAVITKEITLRQVFGVNLEIPNDVYNNFTRHYEGGEFRADLKTAAKDEVIDTGSKLLNIDRCLSVRLLSGGSSLKIIRSAAKDIPVTGKPLYSMSTDRIGSDPVIETRHWMPGEVLFDTVCLVSADTSPDDAAKMTGSVVESGITHKIEVIGADGKTYRCTVTYAECENLPGLKIEK